MNKSLSSLVIKLADRVCNVLDFKNAGDEDYAVAYAAKAQSLYDAALSRLDEIQLLFGSKTRSEVVNAVNAMAAI